MNTETIDLITGVVEEIIAAIPQIVVVLTTVIYSLNAIKTKVNSFPKIASDTKQSVSNELIQTKKQLQDLLEVSSREISTLLDGTNKDIQQKVGATLKNMEDELVSYKRKLDSSIDQTNLLVRQNKVFSDILVKLVGADPEKVSSGVAAIVSNDLNLTKAELEKLPSILIKDKTALERALRETLNVIGKANFEEILKKIGYGKEN